jgi:hypothetical protein
MAQDMMDTGAVSSGAVSPPSGFAYVASSVTGCANGATSASNCVFALHVNPSATNLIVCMATWKDTGSVSYSITGSASGSFTSIGSKKAGTNTLSGYSGQNFWKLAAGGAETITGSTSSNVGFSAWECTVYSYSGTLTSLDGTPQYSNTAAVANVATVSGLTTSNSSDVVIATCNGVTSTCSQGATYTARNDASACNYTTGSCVSSSFLSMTGQTLEDKVGVAAGAQSATFGTGGSTDDVILGLLAF